MAAALNLVRTGYKLAHSRLDPPPFGGLMQTTQNLGTLYVTGSEYYNGVSPGAPAIYWAFIKPLTSDLCTTTLQLTASGMVASANGLAFGFPVIAAKVTGKGAVLAYCYAGPGDLPGNLGPAYAGET